MATVAVAAVEVGSGVDALLAAADAAVKAGLSAIQPPHVAVRRDSHTRPAFE